MRNRAGNFSVGRLMEFLTALGQDVKITGKHPVSTAATILWEDRWQRLIPKADLL